MAFELAGNNNPLKKVGSTPTGSLKAFSISEIQHSVEEAKEIQEEEVKEEKVDREKLDEFKKDIAQKINKNPEDLTGDDLANVPEKVWDESVKKTQLKVNRKYKKPKKKEEPVVIEEKRGKGRPKNDLYRGFVHHTIYIRETYLKYFQALSRLEPGLSLTNVLDAGFSYLIASTPKEDRERVEQERMKGAKFVSKWEKSKEAKEIV